VHQVRKQPMLLFSKSLFLRTASKYKEFSVYVTDFLSVQPI